ncbi:AraC family transcriptional regulator [Paenibacillus sp.]|uniref:AraC family transcriptional regulator n=1 Tax=Paenibacillus sp. TaxID=58172 RepID=UPI002D751966|nr:AraC family transcriptional regulator [Paenibacillus sp.]HZG85849.1 AraC family transcriptional regulator [Paenibacillus sp.]
MQRNDIHPRYWTEGRDFSVQYAKIGEYAEMPKPHYHPYYELFYVLSGERVFFIRDRVLTARPGEMVIVRPHELHRTSSAEAYAYERIIVHYTPEFLGTAAAAHEALPPVVAFAPEERDVVEATLRGMIRESVNRKPDYVDYLRLLLSQLLHHIRRAEPADPELRMQEAPPLHLKVSEIAAYINEHYGEPLTLRSVAERFHISEGHLSRMFAKYTGYPYQEYVRLVRVREAQKRLRETRDRIADIALAAGFGQIAHFNKTFKAVTGLTPRQYRNRRSPS